MPGPVFAEGETVTLRTIEEEDLDFLQRGRNHPEIRRPLTDADPRNGEQIREYFENSVSNDDGFGFLICVADQREATGEASGDEGPASSEADRMGGLGLCERRAERAVRTQQFSSEPVTPATGPISPVGTQRPATVGSLSLLRSVRE